MGYACPVCSDPQADGEHLANHLAFTALLHGDDHEAWLDDHVPDWADRQPAELATHVVEHADEEEFPQQFEDTTGGQTQNPSDIPDPATDIQSAADEVVQEILEEARELTHEAAERRETRDEPADGADPPTESEDG